MPREVTKPGFPRFRSIADRLADASKLLKSCGLCELRCGIDRTLDSSGPCRLGSETYEYKRYVSLNEEAEVSPALRVFWAGCNFRCRFCDEGPDCFDPSRGVRVEPNRTIEDFERALDSGVRFISLIGGEATLHLPTILRIAGAAARPLPIAINSNMYMTPEVLELLEGIVSVYLADFKFGNDACAERIAGAPRYSAVVRRNLGLAAASSAKVIVRHVLIPGHLDCCFRPVVDWVSENLPGNRFQLYTGYVPCWRAKRDSEIGRLNTRAEADEAFQHLQSANLASEVIPAASIAAPGSHVPDTSAELGITVGADGRLYCHDLTPDLARLLGSLFPSEGETERTQDYVQVGVNENP